MRRVLLACLIVLCAVPMAGAQSPGAPEVACYPWQDQHAHSGERRFVAVLCVDLPGIEPLDVEIAGGGPGRGTFGAVRQRPRDRLMEVEYTAPRVSETRTEAFDFVVRDAAGNSASGTLRIRVAAPGESNPPQCRGYGGYSQVASVIDVTCFDHEGDALDYTLVRPPQHGTARLEGANLHWAPAVPYQQVRDTALVRVDDQHGGSTLHTVVFDPTGWRASCDGPLITEMRADRPTAVTVRCDAGVEVVTPPPRGRLLAADEGDYTLLTYVPDPATTSRYVADMAYRSASGRSYEYRHRFIVNPVPPRRPAVTLQVPAQPQRRVLREGLRADVGCDCRFAASIRVGTRDVATVAGRPGSIVLPLDRAAKRHLRRARRPAVRVAIVPDGFRRPTVQWVELLRPQP